MLQYGLRILQLRTWWQEHFTVGVRSPACGRVLLCTVPVGVIGCLGCTAFQAVFISCIAQMYRRAFLSQHALGKHFMAIHISRIHACKLLRHACCDPAVHLASPREAAVRIVFVFFIRYGGAHCAVCGPSVLKGACAIFGIACGILRCR